MTDKTPKVSIVIPVYNGANFLAEAIDSALAQTYRNIEVVVVNDGSTDGGETERIALSYGDKINYYQKKNGGVASTLNFGFEKMAGEYFSWLSHDDLYERTKIEEQIGYLLRQPVPDKTIVACNSIALFENGIKKKEKINRDIFDSYFDIFLGLSAKVGLNGCSLLIPRNVLLNSGGFDTSLPVTQDYDLWYRLKDTCSFELLDRSLVMYRHHDMQDSVRMANMSTAAGDELRARILHGVSKKHFVNFIDTNGKNKKWIWSNYATYRSKGYIKTSLTILRLLIDYYGVRNSKDIDKVLAEVSLCEHILGSVGYDQSPAKRVDHLIDSITSRTYSNYITDNKPGTISSYIESIRNDGLWFFVRKAFRKLSKILRR